MEILLMLVFVSVMFFFGAILAFAYSVKAGEADHADRLELMPFRDPSDHDAQSQPQENPK